MVYRTVQRTFAWFKNTTQQADKIDLMFYTLMNEVMDGCYKMPIAYYHSTTVDIWIYDTKKTDITVQCLWCLFPMLMVVKVEFEIRSECTRSVKKPKVVLNTHYQCSSPVKGHTEMKIQITGNYATTGNFKIHFDFAKNEHEKKSEKKMHS